MSQSLGSGNDSPQHSTEHVQRIDDDERIQRVLSVLEDSCCRSILDATSDAVRSADELAACCEIPLSTTYRKLDQLTAVEFLDERVRLCQTGKHAREYLRVVQRVDVEIGPRGKMRLRVARRS